MLKALQILSAIFLLFACETDRLSNEYEDESLDPNLAPVVSPLQIFVTDATIEACFYKNNYIKMIATHPQISSYAWYKCIDDYPSNDVFLSDSSEYQTSLDGIYRLDIEKNFPLIGEVDTTIYIDLNYCHTYIDIPESFTPNNNGFNTWMPIMEGVNQFYLRITNEDDVVVFETSDPNASFNGDFQGNALPSGTYSYYLSGTFKSRILFEQEGNFELVR